jgi:dTDP-6-deoxy-L-talose 4-dehydrogenase (NAD+)
MKVAVTGATGFIGRHVLRELSRREGVEVVAVSRRAPDLGELPISVTHVLMDVTIPTTQDLENLGYPDVLIHLAWSGLPNYKSLHHFEVHLSDQYRFLAGLVRAGLPSLICTGTCFEYGMRSGELDESLVPDPGNAYGFAKDALRRQLDLLRAAHAFEFTWARLFYMYGDGQPATSLYPQVLAAGERGDSTFKMSPGDQLRDFLPVQTVAAYLVGLAMDSPGAGVVNVCSGQPTSVRSLAEGWIEERGWNMKLELGHFPYPDYEPMAFWGANTRLRRLLPAKEEGR